LLTSSNPASSYFSPWFLQVCGLEALNISADWTYPAPISRTPIYVYSLVLLLDFVLYSILAAVVIESTHRTRTPMVRKGPPVRSVSLPAVNIDVSSRVGAGTGTDTRTCDIYGSILAWGAWTLGLLGGICGTAGVIISQGAGYFWGREVHSYSSLSQEQRTYLDDFDVNYYSKGAAAKGWMNLPRKSASAFDVRPTHRSRSATFGSRSLGDIKSGGTLDQNSISIPEGNRPDLEGGEGEGEGGGESKCHTVKRNSISEGIDLKAAGTGRVPLGPPQTCMQIVDLCKEYRTDRTGVVILHEINAELRQGTVTCLLGKSLSLSLYIVLSEDVLPTLVMNAFPSYQPKNSVAPSCTR
jgi:hypothetical protein